MHFKKMFFQRICLVVDQNANHSNEPLLTYSICVLMLIMRMEL